MPRLPLRSRLPRPGPPILALTLCASLAAAQPPPPPGEDPASSEEAPPWSHELSLDELLRIELSTPSKQLQTAREAPGVVSLVTREQIRQFGWRTIDDILFSQPGFFPSHDFERTVVGARGLREGWSNNHLLLLVDGVPMNDNEAGTAFTWDVTPLFMVKSVEIIRGPGSALYGSNAINGVVAINTISSDRMLGENGRLEVNSEARLLVGNLGTASVEVVAATRAPHVSAVVGFQHLRTDGFSYLSTDGSGRVDGTGALQRFLIQDRHGSDYLFIKLEGRKRLEGLSLQYHLQDWDYSTGHGWLYWAPDHEGTMRERRHIAVLRYRSEPGGTLEQEYVLKYQRHEYDNQVRFYPDGALDGYYPSGVTEVAKYALDELFGRFQLSFRPTERLTLLGGVEYSAMLYLGDQEHYSNVDLASTAENPPPSQAQVPLGPLYAPILDQPNHNMGAYTQLTWSRLLDLPLLLTAGLRYDLKFFQYVEPWRPEQPPRSKQYDQLSPRLALVYTPSPALSLKFQASHAFRAPATNELFGFDTWIVQSTVETIRPEQVSTLELSADWRLGPQLSWRNTLFHSRYTNLIGYSGEGATTDNLLTQSNAGLETELVAELDLGTHGRWSAFGNYSHVHLVDGADSSGSLTWAPAHLARAGIRYRWERLILALRGQYQGAVRRRDEDRLTPLYIESRPTNVPAWVELDINAHLQLTDWASAGLSVTNLLDAERYLVKTGDYPFDYRMEGRRLFASLELKL